MQLIFSNPKRDNFLDALAISKENKTRIDNALDACLDLIDLSDEKLTVAMIFSRVNRQACETPEDVAYLVYTLGFLQAIDGIQAFLPLFEKSTRFDVE